jgi:denticleless
MNLDCHRGPSAMTSAHASARPGAREPLHRHASLHAFLRGREVVRTKSNTTLRPGVRDFVSGAPEPRGARVCDEDAFFERRAARRLFAGAARAAEETRDPGRRWGSVSVSEGFGAESADDRPLAPFVVRFCRRDDDADAKGDEALLAVAGEDGAVTVVDVGAPRSEAVRGVAGAGARRRHTPSFEVKRRFLAHDNAVFDVQWSRGSTRLVTASGDGTARLFDVETAAELGAFAFHRGTVKAVAVRPGSGGDVFASCGRDGALALWDARVASRASASVAPYGERLSLAASSKPVAVVERAHEDDHGSSRGAAKTKTKTKTKARVASVSSAAFAHDGQVLLSAGAADGLVKLWDARRLHRKTPVAAMADADPGASAGGLGRTEDLWGDATTPRRPRRGITSLALAPNGSTRVAASYSDSHIAVFDHNAPSAGPACHLRAPGRRSTFKTSFYVKTAFSPCGTHLASGSCDTAVYVWNADRPLASPAALAGHAGEVSAVDWSPAEFGRIASCADDGTARVWAVDRGFAALKGGRTDDDEDDDRGSDEDEVRVEKTRRLADATPARDASSPAGTSAPTSLRTPALFSRERSIQAYFSPRDSQW